MFLFSCFLCLVFSFSLSAAGLPKQCLDDQSSSLLQLQHDLYYSPNFTFSSRFELWDVNTDCCGWEGVRCDALGHVIGLDLSYRNVSGSFHSIFKLHHLQHLNLAGNNFNTTLLSYGFDKLPNLTQLNLSSSCFHGQISVQISFLTSLVSLDLSNQDECYRRYYDFLYPYKGIFYYVPLPNELEQPLKLEKPDFKTLLKNLRFLRELYLDGVDISFQSSEWCETTSLLLPHLQVLSLSSCGLKDPLCPSLSGLPFLSKLSLGGNPISHLPPNFMGIFSRLISLSLENCNLSGHFPTEILLLPNWVWKTSLRDIHLAFNHLSSLDQLLSNRTLTTSSPTPICNLRQLQSFDASHNNLSGAIPNCLGNISSLYFLDLQGNNLSGILPDFSKATQLWMLKVSENRLDGKLPRSLAKCTELEVLDVGNNMMRDTFPFWLEKLPVLTVLILRENRFYGEIKHSKYKIVFPTLDVLDIASNEFSGELSFDLLQATQLRSLKIGGNKLEGKLSRSLANCSKLEVLDLGNNIFYDTFPVWLVKLPSLKVLILRGNRFYGTIQKIDHEHGFPELRILDIASNNFSGTLSVEFLRSLKAMMQMTDEDKANLKYIGENYYQDTVTIVNKGVELHYEKVLTILTCLDLFNNTFHGRIPEEIQILKSLKVLNLSNNDFSDKIPLAFENLKDLESLGLSENKLSGKIPPQLTSLTFLAALNLSNNQLEGSIPQGYQFNTFKNDSYLGNPKLCGLPLSRKCNEVDLLTPHPAREDEEESWLDAMSIWQIAMIGYASGLVVGLCIGYTVLNELGNKWVYKFKMYGKRNKRISRRLHPS